MLHTAIQTLPAQARQGGHWALVEALLFGAVRKALELDSFSHTGWVWVWVESREVRALGPMVQGFEVVWGL